MMCLVGSVAPDFVRLHSFDDDQLFLGVYSSVLQAFLAWESPIQSEKTDRKWVSYSYIYIVCPFIMVRLIYSQFHP